MFDLYAYENNETLRPLIKEVELAFQERDPMSLVRAGHGSSASHSFREVVFARQAEQGRGRINRWAPSSMNPVPEHWRKAAKLPSATESFREKYLDRNLAGMAEVNERIFRYRNELDRKLDVLRREQELYQNPINPAIEGLARQITELGQVQGRFNELDMFAVYAALVCHGRVEGSIPRAQATMSFVKEALGGDELSPSEKQYAHDIAAILIESRVERIQYARALEVEYRKQPLEAYLVRLALGVNPGDLSTYNCAHPAKLAEIAETLAPCAAVAEDAQE